MSKTKKNSLNASGLLKEDVQAIVAAAQALPEIEAVILFGSRAKGNHKPGSDVDLAIKGKNVSYQTAVKLSGVLNEEAPLPYFFDVVAYNTINETNLIEHIDRVGIQIELDKV